MKQIGQLKRNNINYNKSNKVLMKRSNVLRIEKKKRKENNL